MPTITLAESAKLCQDMLVAGVIETIVDVNPFFEVFPFADIEGNALTYNREKVLGDSQFLGVGEEITAKNPATVEQKTASLTTLIGDAEVNGLIQATRSGINNQKAVQIASKAKSISRQYQNALINGDGTGASFAGLMSIVTETGNLIDTGANGQDLSFELLDELIDSIKDKDGAVDYLLLPARSLRSYYTLLRALGGATIGDVATLPSGRTVPAYRGVPMFRNDFITTNQVKGTSNNTTTIFAGTFDDGSFKHGISGLTARDNAGIQIEDVGISEKKDETITRVKFYCGLANYSTLGLHALPGIKN